MEVSFYFDEETDSALCRSMPMPPRVGESVRLRDGANDVRTGIVESVNYGDEVVNGGDVGWMPTGRVCASVTVREETT